jgi:hypothetical protein
MVSVDNPDSAVGVATKGDGLTSADAGAGPGPASAGAYAFMEGFSGIEVGGMKLGPLSSQLP